MESIDTLVLSGGGARGLAFCGAFDELNRLFRQTYLRDIRTQVKRFRGCSIGALFAFLILVGASGNDIQGVFETMDWHRVISLKDMVVSSMADPPRLGIIGTEKFEQLLTNLIHSCWPELPIPESLNFVSLYELTKYTLEVVATKFPEGELTIFSRETTPETTIIDALVASMSLPGLFPPRQISGNFYLDGGLLMNYPVEGCDPLKTIGFRLVQHRENVMNSWGTYTWCVLHLPSQANERLMLARSDTALRQNTIEIDTGSEFSTFDLTLTGERLQEILEIGRQSVGEWWRNRVGAIN